MKIVLSGNLRRFAEFEKEIEFEATTVKDALDSLVERFPKLQPVIYTETGALREMHRLYLNGDVIERTEIVHELRSGDELGILTGIAGG